MFQIGTEYQIVMCELGEKGYEWTAYPNWTVTHINGTAVTFERDGKPWIVNVCSPLFVEAKPQADATMSR